LRKDDQGTNPVTEKKQQHRDINCFSCHYFYITYDPHFPYGCRAAGFKAKQVPSKQMYVNSGLDCQLFRKKRSETVEKP